MFDLTNSEKTMLATQRQIFKAHITAHASFIQPFFKIKAILECNTFFYTQSLCSLLQIM